MRVPRGEGQADVAVELLPLIIERGETDGSCVCLRLQCPNHVWPYDFSHHRTDDGRAFRMLNIIDEYTRGCLPMCVRRRLNSIDLIDVLIVACITDNIVLDRARAPAIVIGVYVDAILNHPPEPIAANIR